MKRTVVEKDGKTYFVYEQEENDDLSFIKETPYENGVTLWANVPRLMLSDLFVSQNIETYITMMKNELEKHIRELLKKEID